MRAAVRSLIPDPLKTIGRAVASVSMFSNAASARRYRWCRDRGPKWPHVPETVEVQLRQLGGATVSLRTVGSDAQVLFDAFIHKYHLPPRSVSEAIAAQSALDPPCIVDVGANIGVTMAHYAYLYPRARVIGVELDDENAAMCRRNVMRWVDRCTVVHGAAWVEDGTIEYEVQPEAQYAMTARPVGDATGPAVRRAQAISLNTLFARYVPQQTVDFVKMDVEGAERHLLTSSVQWASRVRAMKVELHEGYGASMCIADLQRLGFDAHADVDRAHCVIAIRRG